jgi:hypothetical protein
VSKTAFTLKAFGIYLLFLSVVLVAAPNALLSLFGLPTTTEIWIRVVGVLVFNIGLYYMAGARSEARALFQISIYTRVVVLVAFVVFAALGWVSPLIIPFGVVDFLGGVWTYLTLRSEDHART